MMYRLVAVLVLASLASAASVQKRADEKYGGASPPVASQPAYSVPQSSYAPAAPSYAPAAPSYGSSGQSFGTGTAADSGNLYYYYYPVTSQQQQQAYPSQPAYAPAAAPANPIGDLFGFSNIDFNSLIIPLLLLGGILLLLPAVLGCDLQTATCTIPLPGRRKRDLDGLDGPVSLQENIDSAFNILMASMESEVCSRKIACDLGGLMADGKGKGMFAALSFADKLIPQDYMDLVKALQVGAFNKKTCAEKYKCSSKRYKSE